MVKAVVCPICNGKGTIVYYNNNYLTTASENIEKICHGCNGKGWVEVGD